jgi:hypothetical protein
MEGNGEGLIKSTIKALSSRAGIEPDGLPVRSVTPRRTAERAGGMIMPAERIAVMNSPWRL